MNQKYLKLLGFLVIVGIGLYFWRFGGQKITVLSSEVSPEIFQRTYVENLQLQSHPLTDTSEVFLPGLIRENDGIIYILDYSDFTFYVYHTNGEFQKQIEIERGRGPGEVQHITDFDICKNKLWIVDSENLMIHSYSVETGGYLESYPADNRPSRIACLEDGLIIQWSQSEYLFSKFDYEGNLIIEFGEIIEDQTQNMFSVHGNIQSNGKDRFVYIPFYASLIYHFNGEGELIQVIQTPDGLEFPVTRSEERIRYAPEHIYMRDGVIDKNNNLYVYTVLPADKNGEGKQEALIDKFNLTSGEYSSSVQLPFVHLSVLFNSDEFIIYSLNGLEGESFIHQFENRPEF
jgi:hypothetical protein